MTITDEMVERAARKLYELDPVRPPKPFSELSYHREYYRKCARAALEAAFSAGRTTPMTDIAELISKLRYWRGYPTPRTSDWEEVKADLANAADALARLTTQPLPDEIEGLILFLNQTVERAVAQLPLSGYLDVASALRALAQENERLKGELTGEHLFNDTMRNQNVRFAQRIRKLEAERDSLKIAENHHHEEFARVEAERDLLEDRLKTAGLVNVAIRTETIEECATIAELDGDFLSEQASRIVTAIRALAQTATVLVPGSQDDPAAD